MEKQPHIQLSADLNLDRAVIMGDPARVDTAAKLLTDVEPLACNREYKSLAGTYKGQRILILSTGIGAPSAGIAMEEMHHIGIHFVVRVGSCGAMQKGIGLGELIIAEGVVRDDGLTTRYAPPIYPAVPSYRLLQLAHTYAPAAHYGIVRSHDGFYSDDNTDREKFFSKLGIIGDDMESGAMMVIGRLRGMETLSILNNVVLYQGDLEGGINNLVSGDCLVAQGEKQALQLSLDILHDVAPRA